MSSFEPARDPWGIVKIYPEDFENLTIWDDLCHILDCDPACDGIAIEYIRAKEISLENEEAQS